MTTPVSVTKTDEVWFKNLYVISNKERLTEFFPNKEQTIDERMNSIVRLGIYSSLMLTIYKRDWKQLLFIPVVMIITYVIHKNYKQEGFVIDENPDEFVKDPESTVKPTINNPFMNTMMNDYVENPNKDSAVDYYQDTKKAKDIKREVEKNFNYNLYQSLDDVYDKNNSQRQFYTTPNTKIPSDQDKYLKFMYGDLNSCKTDGKDCNLPSDGLRRNPQIFPDQDQNPTVENNINN
jgi:hypothetical protein